MHYCGCHYLTQEVYISETRLESQAITSNPKNVGTLHRNQAQKEVLVTTKWRWEEISFQSISQEDRKAKILVSKRIHKPNFRGSLQAQIEDESYSYQPPGQDGK